jgi:DNA-binding FadR family transcriptional regulator
MSVPIIEAEPLAAVLDAAEDNDSPAATYVLGAGMGRGAGAITARLRRAIETGVFADGEQLPPERQLATAFGTARSTIRKALNQLEKKGMVARRVGSGTFVNYAGPLQTATADVADLTSPLQLIEARFAVEPYMARLAAIHASARDLASMEAVLTRLESCGGDKGVFTRWDSEFHVLLARCSRNPLLLQIYQTINSVRSHAQWNAMKEQILTPEQIEAYNVQHRAIYEALCQRDSQKVAASIEQHLEKARQDLIGAKSA